MADWGRYEELISELNIALYGFDVSKLPYAKQREVEELFRRKLQIESELESRKNTPQPSRELSEEEALRQRLVELKELEIEKIYENRKDSYLTNDDLEQVVKLMKDILKLSGGGNI